MTSFTIDAATHVSHVHLWVADLDRAIAFYRDLLGLQVAQDMREAPVPRRLAFLTASGYHHHVALNELPGAPPPPAGTTGLHHFALLLPSRRALARLARHLRENAYPIDGMRDYGVSEVVNLRDPDGNGIELAWDRPSEQWPRSDGRLAIFNKPLREDSLQAALMREDTATAAARTV
jgi:catechol 2,3-dioxygenase